MAHKRVVSEQVMSHVGGTSNIGMGNSYLHLRHSSGQIKFVIVPIFAPDNKRLSFKRRMTTYLNILF